MLLRAHEPACFAHPHFVFNFSSTSAVPTRNSTGNSAFWFFLRLTTPTLTLGALRFKRLRERPMVLCGSRNQQYASARQPDRLHNHLEGM
jgi:hypothetical protein